MQLVKLNEEQLRNICEPLNLQRAENYVGKFSGCKIEDTVLHGKIKGNHGMYDVTLRIDSDPLQFTCGCEKSGDMFCKHAAALGLTYIYTPWVFSTDKKIGRDEINSFDELQFFVKTTSLKSLLEELKRKNIGLSQLSQLSGVSVQQISAVVKDEAAGKYHTLTDPLKMTCLFLLEKNL